MEPDLNPRHTVAGRKRYPIEPLARAIGVTLGRAGGYQPDDPPEGLAALANRCGITHRRAQRWHQYGIPARYSDQAAIACGRHPCNLWPGWDLDIDDVDEDTDGYYADDLPLDELDEDDEHQAAAA